MGKRTIHAWTHRGFINRYEDGYDMEEIMQRIDTRDRGKAVGGYIAAKGRQA